MGGLVDRFGCCFRGWRTGHPKLSLQFPPVAVLETIQPGRRRCGDEPCLRRPRSERGVEIEVTSASQQGDGRCSYCHRDKLSDQQVSMTDEGWACPSCFRAWLLRQQSDKPRERSIVSKLSSRLIFPLLLVVVALFILGVLHELRRLNQASNIIRQHMPTQ